MKVIDETTLKEFTENICEAAKVFSTNNKNFHKYYDYVFNSCLTRQDKDILESKRKNTFNFSTLRPFILHGLKGVKDSGQTVTFQSIDEDEFSDYEDIPNDIVADQLTQKLEEIFEYSHFQDCLYQVAQDQYVGGQGIFKVKTDYVNDYNFDQSFYIEHIDDPTTIFKDPKSKCSTGKDGDWCAQKIPMAKEKFERTFKGIEWEKIENAAQNTRYYGTDKSNFSWIEDNINDKSVPMVNIIDYYFYQYDTISLYRLKETGEVIEEKPEPGVEYDIRSIEKRNVYRIRYCANVILKKAEKTVFKSLPFIWVEAESYLDKNNIRLLIPYAKHGFDAMRAKNFCLNYYLINVINRPAPTVRLAEELASEPLMDALRDPAEGKVQLIPQTIPTPGSQNTSAPPTIEDVIPPPIPQELLQAADELDKNLPAIFGTQFPSLDDLNNVSGKALYNLSQYMSASTEILMQNLLRSIVQVATVIKEGMPEILRAEEIEFTNKEDNQTRQVMFDYLFTPSRYRTVGHRGVSTQLQKEANFENLVQLSEKVPSFAEFLQTPPVMEQLLEMLDLQNEPKWLKLWEQFQQEEQEKAANQPINPTIQAQQTDSIKAHAAIITAQAKMKEAVTREKALPLSLQENQIDQELAEERLEEDKRKTDLKTTVETAKINQKHINDLLNHAEKITNVPSL